MTPSVHSKIIKELAARTGFQHCGLSPATPLADEEEHYRTWLDQRHWGVMEYLYRNFGKRLDPRLVMPEARTVIALLTTYNSPVEIPSDDNLLIARYARGKDYHVRVKAMMNKLVARMGHAFGLVKCHAFVDSGLVMEKAWAQRCGVGWRGKNTLLINRHHGSWFFIGILLTDLETEHDTPEKDYCGNCDRCMRACPTGALEA